MCAFWIHQIMKNAKPEPNDGGAEGGGGRETRTKLLKVNGSEPKVANSDSGQNDDRAGGGEGSSVPNDAGPLGPTGQTIKKNLNSEKTLAELGGEGRSTESSSGTPRGVLLTVFADGRNPSDQTPVDAGTPNVNMLTSPNVNMLTFGVTQSTRLWADGNANMSTEADGVQTANVNLGARVDGVHGPDRSGRLTRYSAWANLGDASSSSFSLTDGISRGSLQREKEETRADAGEATVALNPYNHQPSTTINPEQ